MAPVGPLSEGIYTLKAPGVEYRFGVGQSLPDDPEDNPEMTFTVEEADFTFEPVEVVDPKGKPGGDEAKDPTAGDDKAEPPKGTEGVDDPLRSDGTRTAAKGDGGNKHPASEPSKGEKGEKPASQSAARKPIWEGEIGVY